MTFYTRKGDDGTTGLLGEGRVPKFHLRIEALGTLDESTATLGLARASVHDPRSAPLMLNVQRGDLDAVLAVLPALNSPTISQLSNSDWVAVNTIVEERVARDVIPRLKAARATGIVEYPLNKVVL